jgi:hypothetical protein
VSTSLKSVVQRLGAASAHAGGAGGGVEAGEASGEASGGEVESVERP